MEWDGGEDVRRGRESHAGLGLRVWRKALGLKLLLSRTWGSLERWMGIHLGDWRGFGVEGWLRDGELNGELGGFGGDLELGNRRLVEDVM